MASKKTSVKTNARSSSGGKKKTAARKGGKSAAARRQTKERLQLSVFLFVLGALLTALAFVKGESLWNHMHQILLGVFGVFGYLLGILVLYWAALVALRQTIADNVVRAFALCLALCGTLVVFSGPDLEGQGFVGAIKLLYQNGLSSVFGGGVMGALGAVLLVYCGKVAACIIVLILLAACLMLFTGVTLGDAYQFVEGLAQRFEERRALRRQEEEEEYYEEEPEEWEEEEPQPRRRFGLFGGRGRQEQALPEPAREERRPARRPVIDLDLGPDPVVEKAQTGVDSMDEKPEIGPGGTFGQQALDELSHPEPQPLAEPAPPAQAPAAARQAFEQAEEEPIETSLLEEEETEATPGELEALIQKAVLPQTQAPAPVIQVEAPDAEEPPQEYPYPPLSLFEQGKRPDDAGAAAELKEKADKLVKTLEDFGVRTKVLDICRGPTVTRYELQPLAGVKISRITSLADDIALNLSAGGVRIEAPIPGKPAVGIEVPNRVKEGVSIRGILESEAFGRSASPLTFALGKDIAGAAQVADLCRMPHLLIAGSTGSGKSVCVNSIIISFLYHSAPEDVKLILIDPKVVELAEYNGIPHLLMPVVTEPRKAAGALGSAVAEMERRYHLFAENNVREIKSYNRLAKETEGMEHLPYIAIVIDELADLMMVAAKEVEDYICRIAQKARAAGIHLIVATQRPSVDVITGLIKANIPSRIAFAVSSQVDSRTILDSGGAEKLLGMGDMLFLPVGAAKPIRIQGSFVKDEEISRVLDFIKKDNSAQYNEAMIAEMEKRAAAQNEGGESEGGEGGMDPMLKSAVEVVLDAGQASTSLLQRRCKLGYARAARIMDEMEQLHIIGPYEGAKPRQVLIDRQQWIEMCLRQDGGESAPGQD